MRRIIRICAFCACSKALFRTHHARNTFLMALLHKYEPGHSISCKTAYVPSEDLARPANPRNLIRVFAWNSLGSQGSKASSGRQRRLRSACANAQADLSLRCAQMQCCKKRCAPAHLARIPGIHWASLSDMYLLLGSDRNQKSTNRTKTAANMHFSMSKSDITLTS